MGPQEGGRAWAAVEVFVAAADREVGVGRVEVDRQRAGGMREVPDHERAGGMGDARHVRHVVQAAAPIVDLRQEEHRRVAVDPVEQIAVGGEAQRHAGRGGDAVGDVEVGREVAALGDDVPACGCIGLLQRDRRAQDLEQVDRRRIACADLAVARADQPADGVADGPAEGDPSGPVPAPDQPVAPFLLDGAADTLGGPCRQGAERVAVEIDDAVGQAEQVPQRRQRIAGVERQRIAACRAGAARRGRTGARHGKARSTARTGDASASMSLSGSAISS